MKPRTKTTKIKKQIQCCFSECTSHQFSLQPIDKQCYLEKETVLCCCPQLNKKTKKLFKIWPEINADGKDYMPFFIIEADKEIMLKKQRQYKQSQDNRIKNALENQKQIFIPHPGKTRHTCFVCKSYFNDYLTHIQSKSHKQKLRNSNCQILINDLISTINEAHSFTKKSQRIFSRTSKKQLKQQKIRRKQQQFTQSQFIEQQNIFLINNRHISEPSINKNEQNQTLINNYMTDINSFRVSDYLF